jgi:hypothetical protein
VDSGDFSADWARSNRLEIHVERKLPIQEGASFEDACNTSRNDNLEKNNVSSSGSPRIETRHEFKIAKFSFRGEKS